MFKPVAMGFHSIFVVDFETLPPPAIIQLTFVFHHPVDVLDHAVQRTGESQLAQVGQPLFDKRRAHHGERLFSLPVRNVFPFK